jgi:hypothetical protein
MAISFINPNQNTEPNAAIATTELKENQYHAIQTPCEFSPYPMQDADDD